MDCWAWRYALCKSRNVCINIVFSEENLKSNRFRTILDMSVNRRTRDGPAVLHLEDEEVQNVIKLDMHANNYRDGDWGSMRHIVVKEGKYLFVIEHEFILKCDSNTLMLLLFYRRNAFVSRNRTRIHQHVSTRRSRESHMGRIAESIL